MTMPLTRALDFSERILSLPASFEAVGEETSELEDFLQAITHC
jgi:hypothetical protein